MLPSLQGCNRKQDFNCSGVRWSLGNEITISPCKLLSYEDLNMKASLPPSLLHQTFADWHSVPCWHCVGLWDKDGITTPSYPGGTDLGFLGGIWMKNSQGWISYLLYFRQAFSGSFSLDVSHQELREDGPKRNSMLLKPSLEANWTVSVCLWLHRALCFWSWICRWLSSLPASTSLVCCYYIEEE